MQFRYTRVCIFVFQTPYNTNPNANYVSKSILYLKAKTKNLLFYFKTVIFLLPNNISPSNVFFFPAVKRPVRADSVSYTHLDVYKRQV